ncbi:oxysterol-binding protein-related protein 1-like [Penaeus monodon]|uniref:oxysterol-binding protein-related protein 1-like n=1 Tax=Penaeus monodon TaxID=6687 RepID=UPI0018A6F7F9|nr:oxysterol-binding protein-related protein 1-like [Penaeus monodon]
MGDMEQFEDLLLRSARNGDCKTVEEILQARKDGKVNLDISCKGKSKSNQGWTPLHLASYFGHRNCVEVLLQHGAALDELNDAGDTPLHKAALTNREDVVLLLLEHGASVSTINGEGLRPSDLPRDAQGNLYREAQQTGVTFRCPLAPPNFLQFPVATWTYISLRDFCIRLVGAPLTCYPFVARIGSKGEAQHRTPIPQCTAERNQADAEGGRVQVPCKFPLSPLNFVLSLL